MLDSILNQFLKADLFSPSFWFVSFMIISWSFGNSVWSRRHRRLCFYLANPPNITNFTSLVFSVLIASWFATITFFALQYNRYNECIYSEYLCSASDLLRDAVLPIGVGAVTRMTGRSALPLGPIGATWSASARSWINSFISSSSSWDDDESEVSIHKLYTLLIS